MKNYYKILQVPVTATTEEIKKAYYNLGKKFHPDVNGNNSIYNDFMTDLNEAYSVLSDKSKRKAFDRIYDQLYTATTHSIKQDTSNKNDKQTQEKKNKNNAHGISVLSPVSNKQYKKNHDSYYSKFSLLIISLYFIVFLIIGIYSPSAILCIALGIAPVVIGISFYNTLYKPLDLLDPYIQYQKMTIERFRLLTEKRSHRFNIHNGKGETPLMLASRECRDPNVIDYMISQGSDCKVTNENGESCLTYSLQNQDSSIAWYYINNGHKIECTISNMWTLIKGSKSDLVEYLLKTSDIKDISSLHHSTILMHSAMYTSNPYIIKLLLEYSFDGRMKDKEGRTAFNWVDLGNGNSANTALRNTFAYELLKQSQAKMLSKDEINEIVRNY